jgi:hypothetical protein
MSKGSQSAVGVHAASASPPRHLLPSLRSRLSTSDMSSVVWYMTRCDLRGSDLTGIDPLTVKLNEAVVDAAQATVIATALGMQVCP